MFSSRCLLLSRYPNSRLTEGEQALPHLHKWWKSDANQGPMLQTSLGPAMLIFLALALFLFEHSMLKVSGDIFGCHAAWGMPLASSGWSSGMLLNIPQCTGQPSVTKNTSSAKAKKL